MLPVVASRKCRPASLTTSNAQIKWASGGNLANLWNNYDLPRDSATIDWALSQIQGLAEGINKLHGINTPHGDIKPENILIFAVDGKIGRLVIADVGLAKFHAEYTRKRFSPTTTNHGSRIYSPPEALDKNAIFSRKYDVWSFGCVLLEFLVWLVHGKKGHRTFINRVKKDSDLPFWKRGRLRSKAKLRSTIKRQIRSLSCTLRKTQNPIHRTPALKGLLELVRDSLLVVNVVSSGVTRNSSRAGSQEMLEYIRNIYVIFGNPYDLPS
ncbi:putative serine threonine protein kinase [Rosellinia necatrix]|uniref:Putative serine threonine protein kinase n=1 Tax=Rosellinia necatrix TaxID=77044 RepID=A0A1W2TXH0_ROSNE|nr:putative serine threonine protein kinase [Rosellinia necatrix]